MLVFTVTKMNYPLSITSTKDDRWKNDRWNEVNDTVPSLMMSTGTMTTRSQSSHDSSWYFTPPTSSRSNVGMDDVSPLNSERNGLQRSYSLRGNSISQLYKTTRKNGSDQVMESTTVEPSAIQPSDPSFSSCREDLAYEEANAGGDVDMEDGDSVIEDSWRPSAEERSSVADSKDQNRHSEGPGSNATPSELDTFLNALIFTGNPASKHVGSSAASCYSGSGSQSMRSSGSSERRRRRVRRTDSSETQEGRRGGSLVRASSLRLDRPPRQGSGVSVLSQPASSGIATPPDGAEDSDRYDDLVALSTSPHLKPKSSSSPSPIAWQRKGRRSPEQVSLTLERPLSSSVSTEKRMNHGKLYSSFSSFGQNKEAPFAAGGGLNHDSFASLGAYSTGMISNCLDWNGSHNGRPTDAHAVCGDPSAHEKLSVVLSTGDGRSTTVEVSGKEAHIIQSLVEATNESSPSKKKEAVRGWLQSAAATILSPSQHGSILDSERLSTRSSLMVEVSPPLAGKTDLRTHLDRRRGGERTRVQSSVAINRVGDRSLGKYHGQSTEDNINLFDEKKRRSASASPSGRRPQELLKKSSSTTVSKALHPRRNVGEEGESGLTGSLQSFFDCTSPTNRKGANSVAGDRPSRQRDKSDKRIRSYSDPRRRDRGCPRTPPEQLNSSKEFELDDFMAVRSVPTNRRTMMRRMHEVPALADVPEKSSLIGKKMDKAGRNRSRSSRKRRPKSESKARSEKAANEKEMDMEELNKSFLDKFLDHDVEANDSASQLLSPGGTKVEKLDMDEYKASLVDGPIEDSICKLRIAPDFLESSQRLILQDPVGRRDGMKKMKSVPTLGSPSKRLVELFLKEDPTFPVVEEKRKSKAASKKVKVEKSKSKGTEDATKRKTEKKKKTKATNSKSKKTSKESKNRKENGTRASSPEKITLKDLPRQTTEKDSAKKVGGSLRPRLDRKIQKAKSLSNLDARSYDTTDKLILVERLKSLSKTNTKTDPPTEIGKCTCAAIKSPTVKRTKSKKSPVSSSSVLQSNEGGTGVLDDHAKARFRSPRSEEIKRLSRKTSQATTSDESSGDDEIIEVSKSQRKSPSKSSHKQGSTKSSNVRPSSTSKLESSSARRSGPGLTMPPTRALSVRSITQRSLSVQSTTQTIAEGSVLEVPDNSSVCSELTDIFLVDLMDHSSTEGHTKRKIQKQKSFNSQGLSTIGERSTTSWADLSNSDSITKDGRLHLSRRWASQPRLDVDGRNHALKSPKRTDDKVGKKKGLKRFMTNLPFMK